MAFASKAENGRPSSPESFSRAMVLLDMSALAHQEVELGDVAVEIGVEAPVAVLERGEQAPLGARVDRLASDDALYNSLKPVGAGADT